MKKILFILIMATILLFSGCNQVAEPIKIDNIFSVNCSYESDDFNADMTLMRLGNGGWEIQFSAPETVSGLAVSYLEEEILITFLGLETTILKDKLPTAPIYEEITKVLDQFIFEEELEFQQNEDDISTHISTENGDFTLKFHKDSKELISLESENSDFKCEFSDYNKV